ncbi:unnamed protein product [Closterium sp. NIES-54]
MAAAKRVLRYLCSTSGLGLVLGGRRPVVLTGHADASWADDQATQRSSQGYIFSLGSGSVSWRSTRSSSVLGSSYNKAMLALCREHRLEHRTKHIALCYLLARELQQRGQLRLAYVASEANTADIFTKALPPGDHQRFCTMLARGQPKAPKDYAPLRQRGIYSSRDKALKDVQAHALHHRFGFATMEVVDAHVILQCKTAMYGQELICLWECSYSWIVHGGFWMVTPLSPPESHVCKKYKREQGANAIANSVKVMKRLWGNLLCGPFISAKILQQILTSHSKFQISYKQAGPLREEIQKEIYGGWQESFKLLPALADRFREIGPDGKFLIQTVDGCFNRMYIQPSASRGVLGFCRPVVALDGTFLISAQRATFLIAVVLDGNQKITMLAWALVEGENKDSWSWFLHKFLKSFPKWPHRDDASIINDRDKGLLPAARDVLPLGIPHYFCAWHLHQNAVELDDKWDALVAACWRDFAPMANCLLGIVKPISDTSPADASEQQRPAPIIAAEARQQAAENRRQGRDAARAAMGRGTTSRAHGRGAEDASAAGATPTEPEPPSESTTGPMAQPADPCHQLAARSSVWIDACICTTFQLCTHPETCKDRLHPQLHPYGPATCQALVLVSLDHPWPDVGSANPGVNTTADAEEEDEEDADAEEADAEEADAEEADTEDVEALPTSEGVQAEAGVDNDDNTPDSGVADGDHTTHVRTGFRQNKRGTRKKLGINLVHRNRLKAPTRRFGIFTSNAAEQVNSSIVPIRRLPVTPMLGGLMDWYRNRYCECKMAVLERTDLLTEAAEERMVEKETRAEGYELLGGDHEEGTIQTRDTDDPKKWRSFNVNLAAHRDQTYQGRSTRGGLSSMGRRAQRKRW